MARWPKIDPGKFVAMKENELEELRAELLNPKEFPDEHHPRVHGRAGVTMIAEHAREEMARLIATIDALKFVLEESDPARIWDDGFMARHSNDVGRNDNPWKSKR